MLLCYGSPPVHWFALIQYLSPGLAIVLKNGMQVVVNRRLLAAVRYIVTSEMCDTRQVRTRGPECVAVQTDHCGTTFFMFCDLFSDCSQVLSAASSNIAVPG
jgi:hypothetical protein